MERKFGHSAKMTTNASQGLKPTRRTTRGIQRYQCWRPVEMDETIARQSYQRAGVRFVIFVDEPIFNIANQG
jgi:hypothetical protein